MLAHFIGIGSNVAATVNVPEAVRALQSISSTLTLSRVFKTEPEGHAQRKAVPQCRGPTCNPNSAATT